MIDGGSRVFVQTTAEVELKVAPGKGGVTLTLHNCRVHMRNNSRTLDTRFFASPVQQIAVHQRRGDIELDVALRAPVHSTARLEAGPGGTHFWVIDFALAGDEAAAPCRRAQARFPSSKSALLTIDGGHAPLRLAC